MALIRKNFLLTDQYSITTNTQEDNDFCHIELCNVTEDDVDKLNEEAALDMCLDYNEVDDLIAVLQEASNTLKRYDKED